MDRLLKLVFVFIVFSFVACNSSELKQAGNDTGLDSLKDTKVKKLNNLNLPNHDTLYYILKLASNLDSVEYVNYEPFLYFKSGYFLNQKRKNALIMERASDSTFLIELYTEEKDHWIENSTIRNLNPFPYDFGIKFNDYNFDNQKDIYIQTAVSNGTGFSFGHLLTIDPSTQELVEHKEASELGNMKPDINSKAIISEELIFCYPKGERNFCKLINKWTGSQLVTVKKNCPCEGD